jgi:type VI secretion system secreted protein Hcp
MAIYVKFGDIKGSVTTQGFKDWIEVNSFQFGIGRAISSAARSAANRESSEPSISEVVLTKAMDVASPKLFLDAVAGEMASKVEIKFTTTTKNEVKEFLSYELTDTGLSGYSVSSGGDMPTESLSLNFTKIMMAYTGMDSKTSGSAERLGYDLTMMKKV